jgi:hypothetical protein
MKYKWIVAREPEPMLDMLHCMNTRAVREA